MEYNDLIYESGPVKFSDYVSNKYNIVHNMLYKNALHNYFHTYIKDLVMKNLLYGLFSCMHNCLTQYNDDETMINLEVKENNEPFKIYKIDELEHITNKNYILQLINYINNSEFSDEINNVLDMVVENENDTYNYISYLVTNILSLVYDLKYKINQITHLSNINEEFQYNYNTINDQFSDFIIRYKNSLYIIGENDDNENGLILFNTELSNDEIFIYEDQLKSNYHLGFNKSGKFILDINDDIDISSIYNELYYLVTYTNNVLLSLFYDTLSQKYIDSHKIIEKKQSEYFLPSTIIIYEKKYPHKKRIVDLTPYWSTYQDHRDIEFNQIKILDEQINDAEIENINYVNGKVKMYTKMNDFYYDTNIRYIHGDTKINDDLIKNTFVNKIKNMYYE